MSGDDNLTGILDPLLYVPGNADISSTDEIQARGYDFRRILTRQFLANPLWEDMALAVSDQFWWVFEQQRMALKYARVPEVLERVYKIMHLQQNGMYWRSETLTDLDYDRANNSIGYYVHNIKHTRDFISYLAFIRGIKMQMVPLWTTDYRTFVAGRPTPNIIDNPDVINPYFPTTHVGIAIEDPNDRGWTINDITTQFYIEAPIHLVLKWIGELLSCQLPPLYMGTFFYYSTFSRWVADSNVWQLGATYGTMFSYATFQRWLCYTPVVMPYNYLMAAVGASQTTMLAQSAAFSYKKTDPFKGGTFSRFTTAGYWTSPGAFLWVDANVARTQAWDFVTAAVQGMLFEPYRFNLLTNSNAIDESPWSLTNMKANRYNLGPDGNSVVTLTALGDGGTYIAANSCTASPNTTDSFYTVQMIYKSNNSGNMTLQLAIWDTEPPALSSPNLYAGIIRTTPSVPSPDYTFGLVINGSSVISTFGTIDDHSLDNLGGGWYRAWFTIIPPITSFMQVSLAYSTNEISNDIFYLGMEIGQYPTTPIPTTNCGYGLRGPETWELESVWDGIATTPNSGYIGYPGTFLFVATQLYPTNVDVLSWGLADQQSGRFLLTYGPENNTMTYPPLQGTGLTPIPTYVVQNADIRASVIWSLNSYNPVGPNNTPNITATSVMNGDMTSPIQVIDGASILTGWQPANGLLEIGYQSNTGQEFWGFVKRCTLLPVTITNTQAATLLADV